jgi:hypothetical protein
MYLLAFVVSFFLLCFSVPIFLVFGIGSSMAATFRSQSSLVCPDPSIFRGPDKARLDRRASFYICRYGHVAWWCRQSAG